jgi:hypothetical protein
VPGDNGRLTSCGLIHYRRQVCFGVLQLNLAHDIPYMTIVVVHTIVVRTATQRATFSPSGNRNLHQFEPDFAAEQRGGALQGGQRHVAILRIEQPTDLAAAGIHALGKALT